MKFILLIALMFSFLPTANSQDKDHSKHQEYVLDHTNKLLKLANFTPNGKLKSHLGKPTTHFSYPLWTVVAELTDPKTNKESYFVAVFIESDEEIPALFFTMLDEEVLCEEISQKTLVKIGAATLVRETLAFVDESLEQPRFLPIRRWSSGDFSTRARFDSFVGSKKVRLEKPDASKVTIEIERLSEGDKQYLNSIRSTRKKK